MLFCGQIYIGYSQFLVFDTSVKRVGCAWTETHTAQGFARREKNVSFGTLLEYGHADLVVHLGPYRPSDQHERVIEVPFKVTSGDVHVGGPEEMGRMPTVKLDSGDYRLVAAQTVADDREAIELFFEKLSEPLAHSRILVADEALSPPDQLLETVDEA